jgi:hypothetical protein
MDPLSVLSIVAAVVQFVDVGARALSRLRNRYSAIQSLAPTVVNFTNKINVEDVSQQLSLMATAVREAWDGFRHEYPEYATGSPFSNLCNTCGEFASDLTSILDEARAFLDENGDRRNRGGSLSDMVNFRHRQSNRIDYEKFERKVTALDVRLSALQPQVFSAMLLCLWYVSLTTECFQCFKHIWLISSSCHVTKIHHWGRSKRAGLRATNGRF